MVLLSVSVSKTRSFGRFGCPACARAWLHLYLLGLGLGLLESECNHVYDEGLSGRVFGYDVVGSGVDPGVDVVEWHGV